MFSFPFFSQRAHWVFEEAEILYFYEDFTVIFYIQKCIIQFSRKWRFTSMTRSSREEKPPFSNERALIKSEIMRSGDGQYNTGDNLSLTTKALQGKKCSSGTVHFRGSGQ